MKGGRLGGSCRQRKDGMSWWDEMDVIRVSSWMLDFELLNEMTKKPVKVGGKARLTHLTSVEVPSQSGVPGYEFRS